ncbi:MAG: hypothetical protein KDI12_09750 [Anaerolineae bacterium]|nr:hypothetical protein [Anaerolineae bacterium]MCB0243682.1 hypothetical protein [Anaerolineae bacterium]
MKRVFAADIKPDDTLDDIFRVVDLRLAPYRDGSKGHYLLLTLADRTGQIDARLWEGAADAASWLNPGDAARVTGRATLYQDRIRLRVEAIQPAEDDEVDIDQLLAMPGQEAAEALELLNAAAGRITSQPLRWLVESFYGDTDFVTALTQAPPNRPGAALRTMVELLELASPLLGPEAPLDSDLLQAAILLHEAGLSIALSQPKGGRAVVWLGVAVLTDQLVGERLAQAPDFPADLAIDLRHCLLAAGGTVEARSREAAALVQLKALHDALTR